MSSTSIWIAQPPWTDTMTHLSLAGALMCWMVPIYGFLEVQEWRSTFPMVKKRKQKINANDSCHNWTRYHDGTFKISCLFYDIISDKKKYVLAAVSCGESKIDLFDIDSGAVVCLFNSCVRQKNIEYHPLRDEIWVCCIATSEKFGGCINVFRYHCEHWCN